MSACCCAGRSARARELAEAQAEAARHASVHEFTLKGIKGEPMPLAQTLGGKVALIVNTASACGLTPQFSGLQRLQDKLAGEGFTVLAVPCNQFFGQESGTDESIAGAGGVCEKFKVTFPMSCKVDVNGEKAHPLYRWLKARVPTASKPGGSAETSLGVMGTITVLSAWMSGTSSTEVGRIHHNFEKSLVDREGHVVRRYLPPTTPEAIERDIVELMAATRTTPPPAAL